MSTAALFTLPDELLQYICDYLGEHRLSLEAFARASQACYAVASPVLFRRIRLAIRHESEEEPTQDSPGLVERVTEWQSLLESRSANRHVRSLVVTQVSHDYAGFETPAAEYLDTVDPDDELLMSPARKCDWGRVDRAPVQDAERKMREQDWQELSSILRQLPNLAHFRWDCSWPLPPTVLSSLGQRTAIYLDTFWFRNAMHVDTTDPLELSLLCDGRIRSLKSRAFSLGKRGEDRGYGDYTHEAVADVVRGINDGVRTLCLLHEENQYTPYPGLIGMCKRGDTIWPGLRTLDRLTVPCARLQSLETGDYLDFNLFATIFQECDLTELRVLKLSASAGYRGLALIADTVRMPHLRTLVFAITGLEQDQDSDQFEGCDAVQLLRSLPPLRGLRFVHYVSEQTINIALERHGPSLRRLWCAPPRKWQHRSFDASRVARLRQFCPMLEDLSISISRSRGDATELGIYRALGSLPRLQTLSLMLDCNDMSLDLEAKSYDPTPVYPDFDDFDKDGLIMNSPFEFVYNGRRVRNGHARHAMINAALDKELAGEIYHKIATAKPGCARDLRLQRLELRPIRGVYVMSARRMMKHLSQWWLLEAPFASINNGVHPVISPIRSPADHELEECEGPRLPTMDAEVMAVFRKTWPESWPGSIWYYDWHSLPLSAS